jgi:Ca-activated chloride channel family protein
MLSFVIRKERIENDGSISNLQSPITDLSEVGMNFLWPASLLLLVAIPLIVLAYVLIQRRRKKAVVRYSSLSLVREAKPQYSRIKRYLPFALFLLAIGSLVVALARPVSIVSVPVNSTTIMLAMDVSRSMCSTDIKPNRLEAAKDAAIAFIESQKAGTRFGLVAFAGYAELIQTPITNLDTLKGAIESLSTGRRTAIGSGILKSLDAIAEIDPTVPKSVREELGETPPDPLPKGAYVPHIIVLLTDGASNAGPMPVEAAQQAADRGIRVYTIGFGTANGGEMPNCNPRDVGREPSMGGMFGGMGGGGGMGMGQFRRGIDEETLKRVAELTDAEYYSAESTEELSKAFQNLPTNLIVRSEVTEITFIFAIAGAFLAMTGIALAMLWNPVLA